jgi:hypothetical protein
MLLVGLKSYIWNSTNAGKLSVVAVDARANRPHHVPVSKNSNSVPLKQESNFHCYSEPDFQQSGFSFPKHKLRVASSTATHQTAVGNICYRILTVFNPKVATAS